jgi:hypothetical protein
MNNQTLRKECPIAWTKEDGPYPCAFFQGGRICIWPADVVKGPCVPMHLPKYRHAQTTTTVPCCECGGPAEIQTGLLERYQATGGLKVWCRGCSKVVLDGEALAAHIRGDY